MSKAAQQVLEFARGIDHTKQYRVTILDEMNVRQIRESLQMSQEKFAEFFGFDLTTLQVLEQGMLVPIGISRNFLILLQRDPQGVIAALSSPSK